MLGGGAGAADGVGADVSEAGEPVTDPNQRVRRLPLPELLGCCSPATEVLQVLGEALAVRVGAGSEGSFRGAGADALDAP